MSYATDEERDDEWSFRMGTESRKERPLREIAEMRRKLEEGETE